MRCRALRLLHRSSFDKSLHFVVQIATLGCRRFGQCSEQYSFCSEVLASHVQVHAVIHQDSLPGDMSRLSSTRTASGAFLLKHDA